MGTKIEKTQVGNYNFEGTLTKALILLYFLKRYFKSFERNVEIDLKIGPFFFLCGEKHRKIKTTKYPKKKFLQETCQILQ